MLTTGRVKTDAAILGAGGELTTKCAKRRERERQIFLAKAQRAQSFTKKCNLRFASMTRRHGFSEARVSGSFGRQRSFFGLNRSSFIIHPSTFFHPHPSV
jgi:hypothetical protein